MRCGDSSVAIKYKDGTIRKIDNPNEAIISHLDNSVLTRMQEIAIQEHKNVLDVRYYEEIKSMIEENRTKKNADNGYWILGTSVEAIEHGVLVEECADPIESVILYSDGFNFEILGLTLEEAIEQCKDEKGLETLQIKIRQAEEADQYANKQPRFKQSDDMSVIINDVNYIRQKESREQQSKDMSK